MKWTKELNTSSLDSRLLGSKCNCESSEAIQVSRNSCDGGKKKIQTKAHAFNVIQRKVRVNLGVSLKLLLRLDWWCCDDSDCQGTNYSVLRSLSYIWTETEELQHPKMLADGSNLFLGFWDHSQNSYPFSKLRVLVQAILCLGAKHFYQVWVCGK